MADRTDVGLNLAMARKKKRLYQKELAEQVGISAVWLSHLETGRFQPTKSLAIALAAALGETLESLFGDAYTKKDK